METFWEICGWSTRISAKILVSVPWWLPRYKGGGKKEWKKNSLWGPTSWTIHGSPCLPGKNNNLTNGTNGELLPNSTGWIHVRIIHHAFFTHRAPNWNCELEKCKFWSINLLVDRDTKEYSFRMVCCWFKFLSNSGNDIEMQLDVTWFDLIFDYIKDVHSLVR